MALAGRRASLIRRQHAWHPPRAFLARGRNHPRAHAEQRRFRALWRHHRRASAESASGGEIMSTAITIISGNPAPALIERAGKRTLLRFVEFFTVHIANANTRQAYARALRSFLAWCEQRGITELASIEPIHVAAYREYLQRQYAAPTVNSIWPPSVSCCTGS